MDENLKQKVKKLLPVIIASVLILVLVITTLIFTLGRGNDDKL